MAAAVLAPFTRAHAREKRRYDDIRRLVMGLARADFRRRYPDATSGPILVLIAAYLEADLQAEGAQVVMTRPNNEGIGPCVTTRAAIINDADADVAVDIHADGGPVGGRGFAVLEPVADGPNDAVIASSASFASILRNSFLDDTGMPVSTYDGIDGLQPRNNLAGLNLTTVPKVLIECGNMQNPTDAAILVSSSFQQQAATAIAQAITTYLTSAT